MEANREAAMFSYRQAKLYPIQSWTYDCNVLAVCRPHDLLNLLLIGESNLDDKSWRREIWSVYGPYSSGGRRVD